MLKLKSVILKSSKCLVKNYVPREIIFLIDTIIVFFAAQASFLLVNTINSKAYNIITLSYEFFLFLGIQLVCFILLKSYSGIIRYTGFKDAFRQIQTTGLTVITVLVINQISYHYNNDKIIYDGGAMIYGFIAFSLLYFFRIVVKRIYQVINANHSSIYAYVLGTDLTDVAIAESLISDTLKKFTIIGFLSDKSSLKRSKIFTLPVKTIQQLSYVESSNKAVVISEKRLKKIISNDKNLIDKLLKLNFKIYKIPEIENWNNESISTEAKQINLEDLLPRTPIKLNDEQLKKKYANRVIMVTGAAGSIGSDIIRQLIRYNPKKLLLVDQAETALHEVCLQLKFNHPELNYELIIADVTYLKRMEKIFEKYLPHVVFHGAAYKHVPAMEDNPSEAFNVNICGTRNVALLATQYKVERFVFISTDKAVNPTSIMGASKRAAELYIKSLSHKQNIETTFITTRFGNVLGSNGSVIPHFKKQIKQGGPLTVTHKDITRYFMTINEACQLVLEAGVMGNGGEIYVFDMGEQVKILDLARKLIRLSGFIPDQDIKIEFTGLRPGEKLYEELLADKENTLPTHHKKILIAKSSYQYDNSKRILLNNLFEQIEDLDEKKSIKTLKELIPEYRKERLKLSKIKASTA
ncbi:MAG: nucleoside-diphosphate sugar epimerase/dehydratase [Psychroflexus sp.]|nr:nucleoside-diphosphate sugar epimerase/dehydratase [Psychroflexus sp.]